SALSDVDVAAALDRHARGDWGADPSGGFHGRAPWGHPAPAQKRFGFGRIFFFCSAGAPHFLRQLEFCARKANPTREVQGRSSCSFDPLSHERETAPTSDRKG